ncbi:hypothetical protein J2S00_001544 [Caldalkalibacillus uzonensis]|uniref:Uncharacterized protein n=1 Tax=Caldalkalibacillus uzonensis TaxID=353224 RepID=A0ABU0CQR0_9BACI|nr:hypothetical protein [Caldalkalibacillus uzonensis]
MEYDDGESLGLALNLNGYGFVYLNVCLISKVVIALYFSIESA